MHGMCQTKMITVLKFVRDVAMALQNVVSSSRIPMVIILGATGTGKTKLGVELAQKFGTEIISADSMQVYKGLDVVTAKATPQERAAAPHHLLDILEPCQYFTVVDFRNRALKIIDSLKKQNKIPIIVGGTVYYVESIVYQILIDKTTETEDLIWDKTRKRDAEPSSPKDSGIKKVASEKDDKGIPTPTTDRDEVAKDVEENSKEKLREFVKNEVNFTNEDIHTKLKAIDPVMASRLHCNNRRKVLRSIEVWLETGRMHSDILDEQKLSEGKLRMPGETLILWLKSEQSVLDDRLNARVDAMLEQGLIQELLDFHAKYNLERIKDGKPPDYTKGVFQTLGFKEFHEYLMLTEEQRNTDEGRKLLQLSVENMKLGTRRYARRQNKMIIGRFLKHPLREVPPVYQLDVTDLSKWQENVKNKAIEIIESFAKGTKCEYEPLDLSSTSANDTAVMINPKSNNYCDICKRIIIGDREMAVHLNSVRHNKVVKKKEAAAAKKAEENETAAAPGP